MLDTSAYMAKLNTYHLGEEAVIEDVFGDLMPLDMQQPHINSSPRLSFLVVFMVVEFYHGAKREPKEGSTHHAWEAYIRMVAHCV